MLGNQRTTEWFKQRKGRITGSIAGALLGCAPYMKKEDAIRLIVREYHGAEREFKGNVATNWGKTHEMQATMQFMQETGLFVEMVGFFPYEDWLGASPDGIIRSQNANFECKCPYGIRNDESPTFKKIKEQPHYYAQVQIEMLCTGTEKTYFYQWTPHGSSIEVVNLDKDWIEKNIPALKELHSHIHTVEIHNKAHLEAKRVELSNEELLQTLQEYLDIDLQIQMLRELQGEKKDILISAAEKTGKDIALGDHKITKVKRKGSVDYGKLLKEHAPHLSKDDIDSFRREGSEYWRIS